MSDVAAVITVSTQVATGEDADRGGPVAVDLLRQAGFEVRSAVVADDPALIVAAVHDQVAAGVRVIITSGGTGIGPHDHTPQAVRPLLSFEIPGISEEIRRVGISHTRQALISREIAGVITGDDHPPVVVLCVPGSRGGVRDAFGVIGDQWGYIIEQVDGAGHR